MLDPSALTNILTELCAISGRETLPRFRRPVTINNKLAAGFDPVTEADQAAEAAIRRHIMSVHPGHGILGEEEDDHQPDADYCWVIDPIDGTRAYISGLPTWGTLIGLNYLGKPVAGAMHQPYTGETYLANGEGSLLYRNGSSSPLRTSSITALVEATMMTTDPFLFEGTEWDIFNRMRMKTRLSRYGFDCYAYCMVASGNVDLVMESGLNAYDIAPLVPIIEQAGGTVSTWSGTSAANGGQILASANHQLHEAALRVINGP